VIAALFMRPAMLRSTLDLSAAKGAETAGPADEKVVAAR
jgi:hypothetical protein